MVDPQIVDDVLASLSARTAEVLDITDTDAPVLKPPQNSKSSAQLPRSEVFKRIEEDRERHKRLRERRWVQAVSRSQWASAQPILHSFAPLPEKGEGDFETESSVDIEFENEWETVSDWNEDDDEACKEENELCFPSSEPKDTSEPMDLS